MVVAFTQPSVHRLLDHLILYRAFVQIAIRELMLSLSQFNTLPYSQQLRHVWDQGLYLASRHEAASVEVKLYLVDGFFVEIRYYSLNEFEIISAFRTTRKLMPYVEGFDLRFCWSESRAGGTGVYWWLSVF